MVLGGRRTVAQGSVVFLWGWSVGRQPWRGLPSFHHCAPAPPVSLLGAILPGGSSHSGLASVPGGIPADKTVWEHTTSMATT